MKSGDFAQASLEFVVHCDGFNENVPHRLMYLNASSLFGGTVQRIRRCGLVKGGETLEVGFELSKALIASQLSASFE